TQDLVFEHRWSVNCHVESISSHPSARDVHPEPSHTNGRSGLAHSAPEPLTRATTATEQQLCRPSSPETSPTLAIGACPDLSRCVSTASSASHGSQTDVGSRDSLGSELTSRHSSASFHSRHSDVSNLSAQTAN